MYLRCYSSMSQKEITQMIEKLMYDPQFDQWNTKTISFILVFAFGYNGCETRNHVISIFNEFNMWYKQYKPDNYVPNNSLEKMYSKSVIAAIISYIKNFDHRKIVDDNKVNHTNAIINLNQLWTYVDQLIYEETRPLTNFEKFKKFLHIKK